MQLLCVAYLWRPTTLWRCAYVPYMGRLASTVVVLGAAVTGLLIAAWLRVGSFDCPGIVPLLREGVVVGETIYDCAEPTAAWWGLLLGSAAGAAAAVVLKLYLRWRAK